MKNKNSRYLPNKETISERLKRLRLEAGLTGSRLAELTGSKQSRISDIENGKGYLYADELPVYASALNTTVSYLVTGNETANETVSAELGLSNNTINRLRKFQENKVPDLAEAINMLFQDSNDSESIFTTTGENVLHLFREFVLCPERELITKTMNWTNPFFALTKDEALQLRLINTLSEFRRTHKQDQKQPDSDQENE